MIRFCWQCPESGASEEHSFFTQSGLIRISGFGHIDVVEFYSLFNRMLVGLDTHSEHKCAIVFCLHGWLRGRGELMLAPWWACFFWVHSWRYRGCLQGHRVLGTGRRVTWGSSACGCGLLLALSAWFSRRSLWLGFWEGQALPPLRSSLIAITLTIKTAALTYKKSVVLISNLYLQRNWSRHPKNSSFLKIPVSNSIFFCVT